MFAKKNNGRVLLKLGLVLVVLAGAVGFAFSSLQETAHVKPVRRGNAVDAVTGSVTVDAEGGTGKELKAEADGKVVECAAIVEGHRFKEGDVLLQLDTTELERTFKQTERAYNEARQRSHELMTGGKPQLLAKAKELSTEQLAELFQKVNPDREQAAEKLKQAERLFQLNNISKEQLREAQRALERIDLNLRLEAFNEKKADLDFQATRENYELQLERMQIRAPSDGEIVEASIWKGALIGRGHVVGKFMSHDRVVSARISEESFGRVKVGQTALVRLLTYGENNFEAKVSKLLPKADEAQRFKVFLDVKVDSPDLLKPNSTGEVTITVDVQPDSLIAARRALFDGDKLYVVKDGRVEKRQVKVGYVNLTEAQILDGVKEGEHVIVDQLDQFRDGERVRVEVLQ